MSVRAKFYCSGKREHIGVATTDPAILDSNKNTTITLHPVTGGSEENKQFYRYTPGGQMELQVVSAEVAAQFEIGRSYYIDFTPAD